MKVEVAKANADKLRELQDALNKHIRECEKGGMVVAIDVENLVQFDGQYKLIICQATISPNRLEL